MNINFVYNRNNLPTDILKKIEMANVFFTEGYNDIIINRKHTVCYLYSDDYIMPVAIIKRYIFKWADIISEYHYLNNNRSQSSKDFLDGCMECLNKKIGVNWVNITSPITFFDAYPSNSKRIPFGNYVIDLSLSEEEIFAKLNRNCRKAIRHAIKNEVNVKIGGINYYKDFVKVANETWERSNKKVTDLKKYFTELKIMGENGKAFFAYKGDDLQCAVILYFSSKICYPIYAGSKSKQINGANNLLYWEVFKYMKNKGVKYFTFVGARINEDINSKYHNIQRFKESFGGELKRGYLFKVTFNQYMHMFFRLLLGLKTMNFNSNDAIDQEIHKWRELNK